MYLIYGSIRIMMYLFTIYTYMCVYLLTTVYDKIRVELVDYKPPSCSPDSVTPGQLGYEMSKTITVVSIYTY